MRRFEFGRRVRDSTEAPGCFYSRRDAACSGRFSEAASIWGVETGCHTRLLVVIVVLALVRCGSVGEPLPPLLNIPEQVHDLRAKQIQEDLKLEWTWPLLTTEGARLEDVAGFFVYGAQIDNANQPPSSEALEHLAGEWKQLSGPELKSYGPGKRIELSIPIAQRIGKTYALAVRAESRRGRRGGMSNVVVIELAEPPAPPAAPTVTVNAGGVALSWAAAARATAYRVYRKGPESEEFEPLGETAAPSFEDVAIQWEKVYRYQVRGLTQTSAGITEGADSAAARVLTRDTFPPAPPADVRAVVTPTSVELSWRENSETDFGGYRISRQSGDGAPAALNGELLSTPSFSDRTIQPGTTYHYTVTALDRNGNESGPSNRTEIVIP